MVNPLSSRAEAEEADNPDTAVATLRREMLFYRDQATTLCEKIMELLKEQNSRGDLIAMMYKYCNEAKKMTIDCANKLAPYESPKLQAIEVKETSVTRFVIEAPTLATNPQSWLDNVKSEKRLLNDMRNNADEAQILESDTNGSANSAMVGQ